MGPANLAGWLTDEHYNDKEALYADLADAYNAEFKEAVAAGVTILQLDDVGFTLHAPDDYPLVAEDPQPRARGRRRLQDLPHLPPRQRRVGRRDALRRASTSWWPNELDVDAVRVRVRRDRLPGGRPRPVEALPERQGPRARRHQHQEARGRDRGRDPRGRAQGARVRRARAHPPDHRLRAVLDPAPDGQGQARRRWPAPRGRCARRSAAERAAHHRHLRRRCRAGIASDPPGMEPKITYIDHKQHAPAGAARSSPGSRRRGPARRRGLGGRAGGHHHPQRHPPRCALPLRLHHGRRASARSRSTRCRWSGASSPASSSTSAPCRRLRGHGRRRRGRADAHRPRRWSPLEIVVVNTARGRALRRATTTSTDGLRHGPRGDAVSTSRGA